MPLDIPAVRQGLADAATAIVGLRAITYIADAVDPPVFEVGELTMDFDRAMHRALDEMVLTCRLFVSLASDLTAQHNLDAYLQPTGSTSIKTALEVDRTLGGACQALRVERIDGYRIYDVATLNYLGATFTVRVWG